MATVKQDQAPLPAVREAQPPAFPMETLQTMGAAISKSGLFGVKTPDQAVALMLVAQAEGRHPASVAQDYHIIQNRPSLKVDSILARFQHAGGVIEWDELTETRATAKFWHPVSCPKPVTITWTIDMAKRAGLAGKDNWRNFPRAMLRARVVSEGVRAAYPAVCCGMYTSEEVQDMPEPPAPPVSMQPPPAGGWKLLKEHPPVQAKVVDVTPATPLAIAPEQAQPDPIVDTPPPSGPKPPPAMMSDSDMMELRQHQHALKLYEEKWTATLAPYGVTSAKQLTAAQGLELLLKLRKARKDSAKQEPEQGQKDERQELIGRLESSQFGCTDDEWNAACIGVGIADPVKWADADMTTLEALAKRLKA